MVAGRTALAACAVVCLDLWSALQYTGWPQDFFETKKKFGSFSVLISLYAQARQAALKFAAMGHAPWDARVAAGAICNRRRRRHHFCRSKAGAWKVAPTFFKDEKNHETIHKTLSSKEGTPHTLFAAVTPKEVLHVYDNFAALGIFEELVLPTGVLSLRP